MARELVVQIAWDDEAEVWVATSDDVPGLATEAGTYEAVMSRVMAVSPELLRDNAAFLRAPVHEPVTLRFETVVALDRTAA